MYPCLSHELFIPSLPEIKTEQDLQNIIAKIISMVLYDTVRNYQYRAQRLFFPLIFEFTQILKPPLNSGCNVYPRNQISLKSNNVEILPILAAIWKIKWRFSEKKIFRL